MIDLNNKVFCSIENVSNGEVSGKTRFNYYQEGSLVWAEYSGGAILKGHLIATMDEIGNLDMRYHHVNKENKLMTGVCSSRLEFLTDGRLRYYEKWRWTSGDCSSGESIIEELKKD